MTNILLFMERKTIEITVLLKDPEQTTNTEEGERAFLLANLDLKK